ncbi:MULTISPECIES: hypothetical protein [unclassified Microcoleus]|uniref:hypothetical protein n=1 Tax=unclassified Microcoleus TaxID=2642155 RepID=UPI002FCE6EE5
MTRSQTALSLPDEKSVFEYSEKPTTFVTNNNNCETQLLEDQVATLMQLLDFSEQEMLRQAARFQQIIDNLQRELAEHKNKEQGLKVSQNSFTGILNIPNDAILQVEENHGIQRFNQGEEQI